MVSCSNRREAVLQSIAATLARLVPDPYLLVAVDGVDGAGKTVFADELAPYLIARGRPVIRATVDRFHNPKHVRYRRGRDSPEGFYRDSYNYPQLKEYLLDPLRPSGSGLIRRAAFDHEHDAPVDAPLESIEPGAVLVLDGIFLHRRELLRYWDFSIFLDVTTEVSVDRCAARDGTSPDPEAAANRRYVEGQRLYLKESMPKKHASIVVENSALDAPRII
ncbi:uridine kinase [Phytoactinopolyspora mesophila]|uniref:Uridine kinase n=1 Tax=Phytoactinopolyspora mesophila TaxID=2650750 RepID=A0A7K3M3A7_9ACTN|nr:uridine kinase [Phytoactinopolyspora mesophila]NDL57789.1 uridine kinase [Phytoactinopolyspora mesophila]